MRCDSNTEAYLVPNMLERVETFLIFYLIQNHICIATITEPYEN